MILTAIVQKNNIKPIEIPTKKPTSFTRIEMALAFIRSAQTYRKF